VWRIADRIAKTASDVTIGTVIVLAHVVLAERHASRAARMLPTATRDGGRIWPSQISP
jgi:hypothetical protein